MNQRNDGSTDECTKYLNFLKIQRTICLILLPLDLSSTAKIKDCLRLTSWANTNLASKTEDGEEANLNNFLASQSPCRRPWPVRWALPIILWLHCNKEFNWLKAMQSSPWLTEFNLQADWLARLTGPGWLGESPSKQSQGSLVVWKSKLSCDWLKGDSPVGLGQSVWD